MKLLLRDVCDEMSATVDPDPSASTSAYCSDETLAKVKEQLEQLFEKNGELVDQDDYRSLVKDTELLKRYVKRKRNQVEASANFIFEALQWRKRHQISNYKENDFPKEFYEFGGLYLHGKDVNGEIYSNFRIDLVTRFLLPYAKPFALSQTGNFVLHIRTKLYQKISQISDLLKKFTIFMMYKADRLAAEANVGWVIVFDCSEAGIVSYFDEKYFLVDVN